MRSSGITGSEMNGAGFLLALTLCGVIAACEASDPAHHCDEGEAGYVCMVAGTGENGYNQDGLAPEESDLYLVSQARRGPDGLLYVMDFNNQRLRVIDENGHMQTLAGNGFHGPGFTGAPALESPLENPIDFDFLPDGRVVFVSYHDPRIFVLSDEGTLEVIAGSGELGETGSEGDGGLAIFARFIQLDGIAVAPDGAIYVSDSLANRVRVIRGNMIDTVAGTGEAAYAGDGGPAAEAQLSWPTALAIAPDGALYVADSSNHAVRRIAADGTITTVAGTGEASGGGDGGPATLAGLRRPNGLALAEDGTIYIADRSNFRVRKIAPDGVITTVAGSGSEGFTGDGGLALHADFSYLARLTLDGDSLLVSDQGNSCVRRVLLASDRATSGMLP